MSYFTPVEFNESNDPGAPVKPVTTTKFNDGKIKTAIEQIEAELEKVRTGKSEHTSYAIEPGRFGFPLVITLRIFQTDPTEKTYQGALQIAAQDLGAKFAEFVKITLDETKEFTNV